MLERRGLVERRRCAEDTRAVNAALTHEGLLLTRAAQATHFTSVQQRFFAELSTAEIALLAEVFGRFAPRAAGACTPDADDTRAARPPRRRPA